MLTEQAFGNQLVAFACSCEGVEIAPHVPYSKKPDHGKVGEVSVQNVHAAVIAFAAKTAHQTCKETCNAYMRG